ncbi:MAG TPA: hypothetical protein VKV57_05825 [bacterium]|nr:hypothetical protein [bacterium]
MTITHLRNVGCRCLLGRELDAARRAHWATQWQSGSAIGASQWAQLRTCVSHARQASPFYRERLATVDLDDPLTPEAFRRIPPLRRQDVIASWSAIRTGATWSGVMRRRSGGSGGSSVQVPLTRATYCWYIAGTWRGLRWWGIDPADRGAIVLGSGASGARSAAIRAKDWAMNWWRVPVDGEFDGRADTILDRLERFAPAFVYGYPSAMHRLAEAVRHRGWSPRRPLKVIVATGEPVYLAQREAIARAFGCPVAEEYGNGELGSMAFECPEGTLHITAENVFLEAVRSHTPTDGGGVPILATQLRNRTFPLIRYETGDVGVVSPGPCRCGRGLPAVRVSGRLDERLTGPAGLILARATVEAFLTALPEPLRAHVQVIHPARSRLLVHVEGSQPPAGDLAAATAAARAAFGDGWEIAAAAVDGLPRLASGKRPVFVRSYA